VCGDAEVLLGYERQNNIFLYHSEGHITCHARTNGAVRTYTTYQGFALYTLRHIVMLEADLNI